MILFKKIHLKHILIQWLSILEQVWIKLIIYSFKLLRANIDIKYIREFTSRR